MIDESNADTVPIDMPPKSAARLKLEDRIAATREQIARNRVDPDNDVLAGRIRAMRESPMHDVPKTPIDDDIARGHIGLRTLAIDSFRNELADLEIQLLQLAAREGDAKP